MSAHQTRLDRRFAALKTDGRKAFVAFITAGDPDPETSFSILSGLPAAGADIIEHPRIDDLRLTQCFQRYRQTLTVFLALLDRL